MLSIVCFWGLGKGLSWGWVGKWGDVFYKNKGCIRYRGIRDFLGFIFYKRDFNKIGKLKFFCVWYNGNSKSYSWSI